MQKIAVFQQKNSAKNKIAKISEFSNKKFFIQTFNIDQELPDIVDNTSLYLPDTIDADLVLSFLNHEDLCQDLSLLCEKLNIPIIASGKKIIAKNAICPPT